VLTHAHTRTLCICFSNRFSLARSLARDFNLQLHEVKETVTVLKVMAGAISTELDDQAELLEDFEGELDSSQAKLMIVMNKLDKTLAITKGAFVFVAPPHACTITPLIRNIFLCEREREGLVDSSHTARVAVQFLAPTRARACVQNSLNWQVFRARAYVHHVWLALRGLHCQASRIHGS